MVNDGTADALLEFLAAGVPNGQAKADQWTGE